MPRFMMHGAYDVRSTQEVREWTHTHTRGATDRARWTVPVVLALMVSTVTVGPAGLVEAPIQLPSLDWFDEGHTFRYELYNATFSATFNATIDEVDGNTVIFGFWDHHNGTDQVIESIWMNKSREDLNHTDGYTFMWVNQTNVDTDSALIGDGSYQLDLLASTEDTLVFENENRTFRYNASKGWLRKAILDDLDLTWKLRAVDQIQDVPTHSYVHEPKFCDNNNHFGQGGYEWVLLDWEPFGFDGGPTNDMHAYANICGNGSGGSCEIKVVAANQVDWWGWLYHGHWYSHYWSFEETIHDHTEPAYPLRIVETRPLHSTVIHWSGPTPVDGSSLIDVESVTGLTGDGHWKGKLDDQSCPL